MRVSLPLCATCGQAFTAGCPGCELRQEASVQRCLFMKETPTRLEGRVINGALMLLLARADSQGRKR